MFIYELDIYLTMYSLKEIVAYMIAGMIIFAYVAFVVQNPGSVVPTELTNLLYLALGTIFSYGAAGEAINRMKKEILAEVRALTKKD